MLFPTHLIVGYLLGKRFDLPVVWVILGAAAPDLIDKPLAMFEITSLYHTIGHSFFTLIVIGVLASLDRRGFAIFIGWLSHLILDAGQMIINGRAADSLFLLWPIVRHEPAVQLGPIEFFWYYLGTLSLFVEVLIWLVFFWYIATHSRRNLTERIDIT